MGMRRREGGRELRAGAETKRDIIDHHNAR
jgi:hypothetical protein